MFHGEGTEYFRIWIVNLLLSLLTLGIYSAWAKVRTKRYFYGNTELAGDRFNYLASPIAILKGRLIAVATLSAYTLVGIFYPAAGLLLALILFLTIPWIIVRSTRFNATMSAWRGIRFGFNGTTSTAFSVFVLWQLFGVFTLGFGMPFAWYKKNQFTFNNYKFGQTPSITTARVSNFYKIGFALFSFGLGGTVLLTVVSFSYRGPSQTPSIEIVLVGLYFLFYIALYTVFRAMYFNVVYNNIEVANNRIRNSVTFKGYFSVILVNTIAVVLTIGIFYPWASIRIARYLQSNLWIEADDLDSFTAGEADRTSALGDEIGEAFDLGIGI